MFRARLPLIARGWVWLRTRREPDLGRAGEVAAAAFLRARGLHVVARNWRGRHGEFDIVAVTEGNALVFVEVKTTRAHPEHAWDRVDAAKEAHLVRTSEEYLAAFGLRADTPHRFDIVIVSGDPRRLARPLRFLWAQEVMAD